MIDVQSVAETAGIGRFVPAESVSGKSSSFARHSHQSWNTKLTSLTDKVDRADTMANIARHRKWLTNMRFYMGQQLGYINQAGDWQQITRDPGDPIYVVNLLQYFVSAIMKDYVRSQAILDVSARGGKMTARLAARVGSELLKIVQQKQNTPTAIERDGKFCVILGNTFRYTVCAAGAGPYRKEPVTQKAYINLVGSSGICTNPECGAVSDLPNMPDGVQQGMGVGQQVCPECQQPSMEIAQGVSAEYDQIVGYDTNRSPDVQSGVVDPFEMKLPLNADDIDFAGWLRRERFVDRAKLENAYQWAQLVDSATITTGESPLLAQSEIQQSPGNMGGHITGFNNSPLDNELVRFRQYWFRPEEYAEYIFTTPETMANGEVIPANTRAISLFPHGLYIAKSGSTVLDTADEDKSDYWTHNRWEVVPNAIWGQGVDHIIEAQEMTNELMSLAYEHLMHNTTPPTVIDPNYLSRADWSNKPGFVAVLKKGAPTGGVGQAFQQTQPRPLGGDVVGFLEMLKGDMPMLAGGAFSSASGLPDVHTDTARGMAIQRDQALMLHVSRLNRKAEADVRQGKQQLRIVKKHNLAALYYDHLSDFSELELKLFEECDIDIDLEIKDRPGSGVPKSELQKRDDFEAAAMFGGMPMGIFNPMVPRQLRRIGTELFNLPWEAELMAADERNTLLNIWNLLEFAEMAEGLVSSPEEALLLAADIAPVRYRIDDHQIANDTIIDFMKTDVGRHLSPIGELLLNDLITRHKQGAVMKMMEDMSNPMMMNPMTPTGPPPGQPGAPPNVPPMMGMMNQQQLGSGGGQQQGGMQGTAQPDDIDARGDTNAV